MLPEKMIFSAPVVTDKSGRISARRTTGMLTMRDRFGDARVRWDIGRNDYRVEPGLWYIGNPDRESPVLVTSNYRLTFNSVRKELDGIDAWILVLDTKGVNVWCAAGKGTFGTDELISKIRSTRLDSKVSHRNLILPQLGASGVAGHIVAKETGFRVHWGPVYAKDLREYLASGMKKTDRMKEVRFSMSDRLAVAPVEIAHAAKLLVPEIAAVILFSFAFPGPPASKLAFNALCILGGSIAGTVFFPALLPFLPFRAFSAKGAVLGLLWTALSFLAVRPALTPALLPAVLVTVPLVAFLAMNFTGSSTFTCQRGAELEVKISFFPMVASIAGAVIFAIVNLIRIAMQGA